MHTQEIHMSDKLALAEIIRIAANALAGEDEEEEGMEAGDEAAT